MIIGIVISVTVSAVAAAVIVEMRADRLVEQNLSGLISVEVGQQLKAIPDRIGALEGGVGHLIGLTENVPGRLDALEAHERNASNWYCGAIACSRTREICEFAQAKFAVDRPLETAFKTPCSRRRIAYCHSFGAICFTDVDKCENHAGQNRGDPSCLGVE